MANPTKRNLDKTLSEVFGEVFTKENFKKLAELNQLKNHTTQANVSTGKITPEIMASIEDTLASIGIGGSTLPQREQKREERLNGITASMGKDKSDVIAKSTVKRVKQANDFEAEKDAAYKTTVKNAIASAFPETEAPLSVEPWMTKNNAFEKSEIDSWMLDGDMFGRKDLSAKFNPQQEAYDPGNRIIAPKGGDSNKMGFTPGDMIGMAGTAIGSISQMVNTIQNAKATKPVVNHYEGFNEKALQKNQQVKDQIGYNKDIAKTEMQRQMMLESNTARSRTRGSASSINTLRSMDLGVDSGIANAKASGYANLEGVFGQQMQHALGVDTQLMSEKDKMEMTGRTQADDANAANLDNFYSNFAQNIAGMTEGIQKMGSDINQAKHRQDFLNILPDTNPYGIGVDKNMGMYSRATKSKYTPPVAEITETPIGSFDLGFNTADYNQAMNYKLPSFTTKRTY